jgi:EAL domain-containing protein (putative c-di-GMP-specific phosphodiesterase class I)/ActR/RegA family two-component response regulator
MPLQKWQNAAPWGKLKAMGHETQHNLTTPHRAAKLLLADDTSLELAEYANALRQAGYEVVWARHGAEAIAQMHAQRFEAVLCNLITAEADAKAVLAAAKAQDLQVPVIVLTSPAGGPRAEGVGAEARLPQYLTRPVSSEHLLDTLGRALLTEVPLSQPPQASKVPALAAPAYGLAGELDVALASLYMAYQPIVDCSHAQLFGYEALVRCKPGNLASPPALLAAAESLGRLQELSRQIRAQVAQNVSALPHALAPVKIFVNLHAQDLLDPALFDPHAPLSALAHRVVLEITERTPLEEIPEVLPRIARLRAMGYRIALDDLGAGYAGLSTFAQIEPEVVKLDMALVRMVEKSRTKRHIIASMVQLCEKLNIAVVAEGIETIAERDVLRALGCQLLQGYYFGRPARNFEPPTF